MPIPFQLIGLIEAAFGRPASGAPGRRTTMTMILAFVLLLLLPAVTLADGTCNLIIAGPVYVNGGSGTVFAKEANAPYVYVRNTVGSSPATEVLFTVSDNPSWSERVAVPALGAGGQTTVTATDPTVRSSQGGAVTYTAIVDPDNLVAETSESDNQASTARSVAFNGYKGAQYWPGRANITTHRTYDLHGGLVYSFGNSSYKSGSFGASGWNSYAVNWTAANLTVPTGATIKDVRLYVAYTWDNSNVAPDHLYIDFNGVRVPSEHWEHDVSNFGGYADHVYGLLTYNVTSLFLKNGLNVALFTRDNPTAKISPYGLLLAVVYEDPSTPRRQIFLDEGFDLLGASVNDYGTTEEEATGYVEFSGMSIDLAQATKANLTTFCPSGAAQEQGRTGEGNLLVNGIQIAHDVWSYGKEVTGEDGSPQVAVDARDVKAYLNPTGTNVIGMQSTAGGTPCMCAAYEFLVVEYPPSSFVVSLSSGWNLVSWPVSNGSLRASDLVNNASLGVIMVTRYVTSSGTYSSYYAGASPSKDFVMTPDAGYFVKASHAGGLVVVGEPMPGHNVGVYQGWNLLGWSCLTGAYASDVLARAGYVTMVTSYTASSGTYKSYYPGASPSKNVLVSAGYGYYVRSASTSIQQLYVG